MVQIQGNTNIDKKIFLAQYNLNIGKSFDILKLFAIG